MKIGLLGGSFNPAHEGHIHISVEAKKHLKLQKIWWLPTKQNPLKEISNSDFDQRLKECFEITKNHPSILIKDFEKNITSNYTIDLLTMITKKYPQHQFFFIMGADNMINFHLWKKWREIIKLMPLIILDRDNFFVKATKSKAALYCQKLSSQNITKCYFLKIKKSDVSSTKKREQWNVSNYQTHANFVPSLTTEILEMLNPKKGEKILDIGCGDGVLSKKIADSGAIVKCIDGSSEMVNAALKLGLDASVEDAHNLKYHEDFDAVFSNAALHWMKKPDLVLSGIFKALKKNGRFVAEFGGHGNVKTIANAISIVLKKYGLQYEDYNPWYFPTIKEYSQKLENAGFKIEKILLVPRPTKLPTDIAGWLKTFSFPFLKAIDEKNRDEFIKKVQDLTRSKLQDENGDWYADYVRCRFIAVKEN